MSEWKVSIVHLNSMVLFCIQMKVFNEIIGVLVATECKKNNCIIIASMDIICLWNSLVSSVSWFCTIWNVTEIYLEIKSYSLLSDKNILLKKKMIGYHLPMFIWSSKVNKFRIMKAIHSLTWLLYHHLCHTKEHRGKVIW